MAVEMYQKKRKKKSEWATALEKGEKQKSFTSGG